MQLRLNLASGKGTGARALWRTKSAWEGPSAARAGAGGGRGVPATDPRIRVSGPAYWPVNNLSLRDLLARRLSKMCLLPFPYERGDPKTQVALHAAVLSSRPARRERRYKKCTKREYQPRGQRSLASSWGKIKGPRKSSQTKVAVAGREDRTLAQPIMQHS